MQMEVYFPRGGSKPAKDDKITYKHSFDLFGNLKSKAGRKTKQQQNKVEKQKFTLDVNVETTSASLLTYNTIEIGMVMLCSVISVRKMKVTLSLPGRLCGKLMITEISTPYRKLLQSIANNEEPQGYKTLMQLFQPGQCLLAKVIKISNKDDKCIVEMSVMPEDVNAQLNPSNITEGMLLWGAVNSVEDHVYVVDLGIKNCRTFLEKSEVDEGNEFGVGEVFWSVVGKCDVTSTSCTIKLNARSAKIQAAKVTKVSSLDGLLPGMKVDFTATKYLNNGLEGTIFEQYKGYVHEGQLRKPLESLKYYKLNKKTEAHILYVMPVTKLAFLTLAGLNRDKKLDIEFGTITNSKIISVTKGGFYTMLNNQKGYVSYRRLKKGLPVDSDVEFKNFIKDSYPKGSSHRCRVLSYDYMDRVYTCTFEKHIINEKFFSLKDFEIGQEVTVEIKELQSAGLLVRIGLVNGYIVNEQLTDALLHSYVQVKSRFKVGQKINVKVLYMKEEKLHFTMKPSFMENENLTNYEMAERDKYFIGIIYQIASYGLIVSFFGGVRGIIPKQYINYEGVPDFTKMFHIGQLIRCRVENCKPHKKSLSLTLLSPNTSTGSSRKERITSYFKSTQIEPDNTNVEEDEENITSNSDQIQTELEDINALSKITYQPIIRLGSDYDVTITKVLPAQLEVVLNEETGTAIIPRAHLSKFPALADLIFETCKEGQVLHAVCIKSTKFKTIFSVRDRDLTVFDLSQVKEIKRGTLLPCSVLTINRQLILEGIMGKGGRKRIYVQDISGLGNIDIKFKRGQYMMAKVLHFTPTGQIRASIKLSDCWNRNLDISVNYLWEYLSDVRTLWKHYHALNDPLAMLNIGQIVTGIVQNQNSDGSLTILLSNGVYAHAIRESIKVKGKVKSGSEVVCIVLWLNFEKKYVEVSLSTLLMSRVNRVQNGQIDLPEDSLCRAQILLKNDDFILVALRGIKGKGQFVFLPGKLHPNDFVPNLDYYKLLAVVRIQIMRKRDGIIIGVLSKLKRDLRKISKSILKRKRDISISYNNIIDEPQAKQRKINLSYHSEISDYMQIMKNTNTEENVENKSQKRNLNEDMDEIQHKAKKKKKETNEDSSALMKNEDNFIEIKYENEDNTVLNEESFISVGVDENLDTSATIKSEVESEDEDSNELEASINYCEEEIKSEDDVESSDESSKITENAVQENLHTSKGRVKKNEHNRTEPSKNNQEGIEKLDKSTNLHSEKTVEHNLSEASKDGNDKFVPVEENIQLVIKEAEPVLPGANDFWNVPESEKSDESSEDEVKVKDETKPKKKMTPAERSEAARLEEERIRQIEIDLADSSAIPKTADQFDRLVLAQPNNSMLWINYMAFHLEGTEIEKARVIARKALTTIEFREEQEKLNVWIAFLNLENRYGTKESFSSILQEAVQMNESLAVYLQVLNILAESNKITEFNDILAVVTRKYKQEFKMWIGAAESCYKCDQKEHARNLMQRALKSLNEKQHVNFIVQIAFLECRFNEPERAEALLENVLASYPKRVDIWTSYIDMLVKGNRIHIARNVLERAVSQRLPAKKMKTLFTKYIEFETKFGDEENIKKVRQKATDYVKRAV